MSIDQDNLMGTKEQRSRWRKGRLFDGVSNIRIDGGVAHFELGHLHPKVSSDISKIMEFYQQVATAELAMSFIESYGISFTRRPGDPNPLRFASATSVE